MIDDLPSQIGQTEILGRGVFDSKKASDAARGVVPPRVFRERTGVRVISVDRLSFGKHMELAELHDQARPPQRFHGWAVLEVADATQNGRTVCADKLPKNPCHALISLPSLPQGGDSDEDDQTQHATSLARVARWQSRP